MFTDEFAEQGCLVVNRLFEPALIDAVRGEYELQYNSFRLDDLPLHMKVGDRRLQLPLRLRGPILDLCTHPLLRGILASIFETPFLIDNFTCVTALPGARDQHFHRDHPDLFPGRSDLPKTPPYAVTVAVPLIDLTEEIGTTKLMAGSMTSDGNGKTGPSSFSAEVCPHIQRGGSFLVDYRLWHRGLANRSKRDRPILYIVYAREWFTDVVNFKLHSRMLIDAHDAQQIPVEHRPIFQRIAASGLLDITVNELVDAQ